jgi:alpha-amylase/alpha-mannosidase (GH57 family)
MKYVCVHGHFYQPPRENPSLEAVELQDSAYPYHDWNERVTAECYAPNATSRLLDEKQQIAELVNNYSQMSFNFGPTLLMWMAQKAPDVLESIRQADHLSREHFGGHGSAIAQVYNHMILPLACARDKETQVIWGMRDFIARFGRQPEGMWLPETAVDTASLEALAAQGIRFTILAPRQARRVRAFGSRSWRDVSGDRIDPSHAYQVRLPSRKTISVFFYDGPISHSVAFERLLDDGKRFADRLMSGFCDERSWPQLSHIATDGESYGHHHRYGEMALSYALHYIETNQQAQLTNYGQFLEMFPPNHWVEIVENTSWSCVHGLERWKSNCGCHSDGHDEWNQQWRAPLRESLDWLRDTLAGTFEEQAARLLKDPWKARNDYIAVVLNRSEENVSAFFQEHAIQNLEHGELVRALKLLEMQRHAMLMYTSCGWFFDELSGLETVQVLQYAGRAVQLAREVGGEPNVEQQFLERLRNAKSNLSEHGSGEEIYKKWVAPAAVTMDKVAGHYAVSSLFENYGEKTKIYCYSVDRQEYGVETEGRVRLAVGRAHVRSAVTTEDAAFSFAVLHLGDHNLTGGVREFREENEFQELRERLSVAFAQADTAEVIRILDEQFPRTTFALRSLFRDEQRHILDLILKDTLNSVSVSFGNVYEHQAALIRFLNSLSVPVPPALLAASTVAVNSQLQQALGRPDIDAAAVKSLLREAAVNHVALDTTTLEYSMRRRLEEQSELFARNPKDLEALKRLRALLDVARALPLQVHLWRVQNLSFAHLKNGASGVNGSGDPSEKASIVEEWGRELSAVREQLHIRGPQ